MTGRDRSRVQAVNGGMLASRGSYSPFLAQFDRADFQTAKGTYQIREYLATRGTNRIRKTLSEGVPAACVRELRVTFACGRDAHTPW